MTSDQDEREVGNNGAVAVRLRGVHHIGITVRSIEKSLEWYADLFGVAPDLVEYSEGPETSATVQLEQAKLRFAFLPVGNTIIELLEYQQPVGRDFDRQNCDVGSMHVCLEVDDIAYAHRALTRRGVPFSSAPVGLAGPLEGHACCYFRGPDGIQFELWQQPDQSRQPEPPCEALNTGDD